MAVEREELHRLIETISAEQLPMLNRIVRWLADSRGERELIWDPDEVALVQDILVSRDAEQFFDSDEADAYLNARRHDSGSHRDH